MTFPNRRFPIRIIARPKLSGLGEHWGVQLTNGNVAHLTEQGERMVTFSEFAQGCKVREVRRANPYLHDQILRRVFISTQNPGQYRLLDRNCETYATWLIGEQPQSPQVLAALAVGIIAALVRFG